MQDNNRIKGALKVAAFFSIGILLFWLAYRGQDVQGMMEAVSDTRWIWVVMMLIVMMAGHYSRAARWKLLLEPFGYNPRCINLFFSVMIMYLSNMAIPRSGEVARCGIIARYEKIPFAKCLGTVVTERIADMLFLLVLTVIVLISQTGIISDMIANNPAIADRIDAIRHWIPYIIAAGVLMIALGIVAVRMVVRRNMFGMGAKLGGLVDNFREGLLTILKLRKRWQFLWHSVFINFTYFFTLYLAFRAFGFTSHLGLNTALTVFVLATFGVVVPSPGGMGTWHFIVIELLSLFGVRRDPDAGAFALVVHGVQDVLLVIVGFASMMLMPVVNRNYQPDLPDAYDAEKQVS